jgi:hypothetical protein
MKFSLEFSLNFTEIFYMFTVYTNCKFNIGLFAQDVPLLVLLHGVVDGGVPLDECPAPRKHVRPQDALADQLVCNRQQQFEEDDKEDRGNGQQTSTLRNAACSSNCAAVLSGESAARSGNQSVQLRNQI